MISHKACSYFQYKSLLQSAAYHLATKAHLGLKHSLIIFYIFKEGFLTRCWCCLVKIINFFTYPVFCLYYYLIKHSSGLKSLVKKKNPVILLKSKQLYIFSIPHNYLMVETQDILCDWWLLSYIPPLYFPLQKRGRESTEILHQLPLLGKVLTLWNQHVIL